MPTASEDIDSFIESHRSKINQQPNRQQANQQQQQQQPPPPPPLPPVPPLNNLGDQANFREVQVSEDQSSGFQSHYSPSPATFTNSSYMEQGQHFSNDDTTKSYFAFFDRFGTHDQVRARLNDDLKREYNEYLQSLKNMAKSKTANMNTPRGGNTTRQTQFQQEHISFGPQGQQDKRTIHNAHSMNDISSSSRTANNSQSVNDMSSASMVHNVQSMSDLSSTSTADLAARRAHARQLQQHTEQYIRDREEYILELYEQIYELEARIRQLDSESRKLTVTNSTSATRARYAEDLNALNALLAERLNQRVAIDHELAQILDRPPVAYSGGRFVVNGASTMTMPVGQVTQAPSDNFKIGQQTSRSTEQTGRQTRRGPEPQQFQSPRSQTSGRPPSPNYARGSIYNGIFGLHKTEEQIMKQERYRQDLLQQIEEKRQRDAAELARRRAEEERERLKQLAYEQQLARQMAEDALRKQQQEEEERRRLLMLEEEAERQRMEEELERQRKEDELERQRRLAELARQREEDDLERQQRREEAERKRKEEEAERQRKREEAERLRKLQDLERQRRKVEDEEERRRREEEERQRRKQEDEEERRRREEEEERRRREEEEEEERRRRRKAEDEEEERRRREEEEERRRREEEWRRSRKVVRTESYVALPREESESDVLRRLQQLKRQLQEKENRLRDAITTESTTTIRTRVVDHSSPPYLPPPQPFYLQRRESSDDLLDIARIHYRDAPLTHDILLNILKTADGDELNPSYIRDDSVIMRGIGEGKRITSAEFLTLPKRPDVTADLFSNSIESLTGRRRYGNSLPVFYDDDDPVGMANRELNKITVKNDHRLSRFRYMESDDGTGADGVDILERFEDKQRSLQRHGSQVTVHDDAWLK